MVDCIKKHDPTICSYKYNDISIESKRMEKICHANFSQRKAGVAIAISDEVDFRGKSPEIKRALYN